MNEYQARADIEKRLDEIQTMLDNLKTQARERAVISAAMEVANRWNKYGHAVETEMAALVIAVDKLRS
jgi:hypothetical protein